MMQLQGQSVRHPKTQISYSIGQQLGKGASGFVYKCKDEKTQKEFAIKQVKNIYQMEREISEKLVKLSQDFKNVVKFHDVFSITKDKDNFYVLMEYCNGFSLYELMYTQKKTFTEKECVMYIYQIACGIQELHMKGLIHRDVNPENIISHQEPNQCTVFKLCDFDNVKQLRNGEEAYTKLIGTPYYMAPEIIQDDGGSYGPEVDVWALGLVFYEMLTGQTFFKGCINNKLYIIRLFLKSNIAQCTKYKPKCLKYAGSLKEIRQNKGFTFWNGSTGLRGKVENQSGKRATRNHIR